MQPWLLKGIVRDLYYDITLGTRPLAGMNKMMIFTESVDRGILNLLKS